MKILYIFDKDESKLTFKDIATGVLIIFASASIGCAALFTILIALT